jgi:peptide/nickel transport system substrate-binding protein
MVAAEGNPDFLDPGFAYTPESWQILANTGNGLLAFRRESGVRGAEVVPDLARELPDVSADGRTLTFTLRKGVRFGPPANREIRASDVKASIERLFLMRSGNAAVYAEIEGARDLLASGKGTLEGIQADDDTGRVVIHLTKPDPSFPAALALPFAFVLPRETPPVDQSTAPPVATGPYRVASYTVNREVVLERNPNFVPRPDAPAGEVDRIVIRLGVPAEAALRAIARGELDYTQSRVNDRQLARIDASKVVIHRSVEPATYYYFMNVNVPPFDDVRVRRAVNLAIDRQAIASLFHGEAMPTAQLLPPTVPGFRRLAIPRRDLPRARALVRQAGAVGTRVTVWGHDTDPSPAVTRHLAATLRTLGFRVTVRMFDKPTLLTTLGDRRTRAQIGYARWRQTLPDGSDWFGLLVDGRRLRASENLNYSYVDDQGLNRLLDRASATVDPSRRAAAWAATDRAVAAKVPIAPFANSVRIDVVSPRVSGYTFHQMFGFLWSKASVQ